MFRIVLNVEDKRLAEVLKLLVGKAEMPEPPQPILSITLNGKAASERSPEAVVVGLPANFHFAQFRDRCVAMGYSEGNTPNVLTQARERKLIAHDKAKGRGYWKRIG